MISAVPRHGLQTKLYLRMVSLLSCEIDMTEWLKETYKGLGASGEEEDLVLPTDQSYR